VVGGRGLEPLTPCV